MDFELLQGLLRKKEETEFKIETLRYSKNPDHRQEKERLQVDLEQLVQIIQKKRRFGVIIAKFRISPGSGRSLRTESSIRMDPTATASATALARPRRQKTSVESIWRTVRPPRKAVIKRTRTSTAA